MTNDHYHMTKVVQRAKDWRETDKAVIGAAPEQKPVAKKEHRRNEQKLREAVDQLTKRGES